MALPLFKNIYGTVLIALRDLGGTASVKDVENKVAEILNLPEEDRKKMHRDNQTKLSERVAWARYYLKRKGFLESSKRGTSVLSEKGKNANISGL
ncbi:MAG: winged helix-turn-helix domain-containing protein [Candidatus Paceibacterota bacterium]|jgi:restriction system protein